MILVLFLYSFCQRAKPIKQQTGGKINFIQQIFIIMKGRQCNMRKWIALLIMISLLIKPAYRQSGNCYEHGEQVVYSGQRAVFTVCSIYTIHIEMCTM